MELSKSALSHPVHVAFHHLQEVSQSDATATSAPWMVGGQEALVNHGG